MHVRKRRDRRRRSEPRGFTEGEMAWRAGDGEAGARVGRAEKRAVRVGWEQSEAPHTIQTPFKSNATRESLAMLMATRIGSVGSCLRLQKPDAAPRQYELKLSQ
eukprot:3746351-Rhodomonas_salina.1